MTEQEKKEELHNIGLEMHRWLTHDKAYVYTLNAYAHAEGLLSDEDAAKVKADLDDYYKDDVKVDNNKSKYMMAVFKKIGFTPTKILWLLIDQFPKYCFGNPENATFIAHDTEIIKQIAKMDSIGYYKILNDKLIQNGYIEKSLNTKLNKMTYKINFHKIMEEYTEE